MNERDKTAHMMQDSAGMAWGTEEHFQRFANLIRADEREKFCAVLRQLHDSYSLASHQGQIKTRGDK